MIRPELVTALKTARPLHDVPSGYLHSDLEADSSVVLTGSPQELARLMREAYIGVGLAFTPEDHDYIVRHEGQHARAGLLLGATAVDYALRVVGNPRPDGSGTDDVTFIPMTRPHFARPTSRLMDAAIAAHPADPSRGDIAFITSIGYSGLEEVTRLIVQGNADFGLRLPVPLSAEHEGLSRGLNEHSTLR